ncbi:TPA: diacylglycerol kinase [Pseudomonas aeruginosa]|uniref:Diacylglycerol kinase n=1 Tax=Pollutimonas bauzanensis TaxID=658167 RepID=A0A1M6BWX1_9BURK|nr:MULTISPECIES: diacylglycerol kinase [Alcaligenaceae]QCS62035.1 diacylglycerol kinase [Achromobacter denitrificans]TFL08016.1 diacylglycerol kinase [Pusillimonas caeni]SHI53236.1 diacylglycerol kinase (ATP) [Pollutimonas bauzanensis]
MYSPYKSKGGFSRLLSALRYSIQGLIIAVKHEAAFRQELILAVVLTPVALWISENVFEAVLLIGSLLFVLIIELLNSALEAVADTITIDHHPMIGRAKDLGSAAVLLSLTMASLIWIGVILA